MTLLRLLCVCIALVMGNFIYQAFAAQEWGVAAERSFFQALALGTVYVISVLWPR